MNNGNRAFRFLSALCWSLVAATLFAMAYMRLGDGIQTALPGIMLTYLLAAGLWLPVLFPVDDALPFEQGINRSLEKNNAEFNDLFDSLTEGQKSKMRSVRDGLFAAIMIEREKMMGVVSVENHYSDTGDSARELRELNELHELLTDPNDARSPASVLWD